MSNAQSSLFIFFAVVVLSCSSSVSVNRICRMVMHNRVPRKKGTPSFHATWGAQPHKMPLQKLHRTKRSVRYSLETPKKEQIVLKTNLEWCVRTVQQKYSSEMSFVEPIYPWNTLWGNRLCPCPWPCPWPCVRLFTSVVTPPRIRKHTCQCTPNWNWHEIQIQRSWKTVASSLTPSLDTIDHLGPC